MPPQSIQRKHLFRCGRVTLICLVALMSHTDAAEPVASKSWPNWMGPNRDGVSTERGWKTEWPESGLPVLWAQQIGIGFSSISLASGRLYTMGHIDGEEIIWCLNADTGVEIWNHHYPCELNNNLHEGGPGSTPTIDGDRVYTLGKEGQVFCLNAETGKVLWDVMLQDDLNVHLPEWGFASSAVITGNQVIFEGGRVVSYDKLTGKKLWQTDKREAGYGSAALFPSGPDPKYAATLDCEGLRITKLTDGAEVAFRAWPSPFRTNATTPIVHENRIFISTAYDVGCGLFEFDGTKLKQVYVNKNMRNHFNNSILLDGYLYGFDGNSNLGRVVQLTCLKWGTGEVAWKQRGLGCGSLMIADKKLVCLSESGNLVVAKASPTTYEELGKSPFLTGRCWTVPVLFGQRIYGRNAAGKLVCVELPRD